MNRRKHYEFSQAKPDPYAKRLKKEVAPFGLMSGAVNYFGDCLKRRGFPPERLLTCICVNAPQAGSG